MKIEEKKQKKEDLKKNKNNPEKISNKVNEKNEKNEKKEQNEQNEKNEKTTEKVNEQKNFQRSNTDVIKRKNQKEFKFFINFLKFNGNFTYSLFLKYLLKDQKSYDGVYCDNFDKYAVFFDNESEFFLHTDAETRAKYFKAKGGLKWQICKKIIFF